MKDKDYIHAVRRIGGFKTQLILQKRSYERRELIANASIAFLVGLCFGLMAFMVAL